MYIKIVKGIPEDINELEQLYNDINDALAKGMNYPGWIKGVYPIRENAEKGIEQEKLFVARDHNKIVGSIILNHEPENGYENAAWHYEGSYDRIFVVHTLVVHPDYQKLGIGRELLKFAETYGAETGMKTIRLDVSDKNMPAIKLYESFGYQYIATVDLGLGKYGLPWFKLYDKLI